MQTLQTQTPLASLDKLDKLDLVPTQLSEAKTWLQKHERLILVLAVILAAVWIGNKYLNVKAAEADKASAAATKELNDQKAKDAEIVSQVTQLNAQYQALIAQLSAQNAQLTKGIAQRTTTLTLQQATDKALPVPEVDRRWAWLIGTTPDQITPNPIGTETTVTDTAAHATVEQLEQVPVLAQNLKDETTVAENNGKELAGAKGVITGLTSEVASCKVTVVDEQKACDAKVAKVKADANKSKRNWFVRGLGVGAGVALYVAIHWL